MFNVTLIFNRRYVILTYAISQLYNRNYPVMGRANKFIMREDNTVQCELYRNSRIKHVHSKNATILFLVTRNLTKIATTL